jgi:hypothetical protein
MALKAASTASGGCAAGPSAVADLAAASMSFVHAPSVAFRAHRDYLHSTTLYKELMAGAAVAGLVPDGAIELRVRRLVRCQPELRYSRSPIAVAGDAPAVFSLRASGAVWQGAVVEREPPIRDREPYDETPIANRAVTEGTAIRLSSDTGMQPIEVITSLTLLLHQRLFTLASDRKWYLARIELTRPLKPDDADTIRLELVRRFGTTMTRSSIAAGDEPLGHIEFIAGPIG